jgi:hypothetical protein
MSYRVWLIFVVLFAVFVFGGMFLLKTTVPPLLKAPYYDIDAEGIPQFINADFIELDKIECIKRFRSGLGADSPLDSEECRDVNHDYFAFEEYRVDKGVKIYSPINGTIVFINQIRVNVSGTWKVETVDLLTVIQIQSPEQPAFTITLSCIDIRGTDLEYGKKVSAGQHIGYASMSFLGTVTKVPLVAIQISVNTPNDTRILSYFEVMTDNVFQSYKDRGATSRNDFIIPREERDEDPLNCTYDPAADIYWIWDKGNIPNWVYLGKNSDDYAIISDYI